MEKLYETACTGFRKALLDLTMSSVLREGNAWQNSIFIEIYDTILKKTLHGLCITVDLFVVIWRLLVLGSGVKIDKNYVTYDIDDYCQFSKVAIWGVNWVSDGSKVAWIDTNIQLRKVMYIALLFSEHRILLSRTKRHRTARNVQSWVNIQARDVFRQIRCSEKVKTQRKYGWTTIWHEMVSKALSKCELSIVKTAIQPNLV
jgi:hypothetical protein